VALRGAFGLQTSFGHALGNTLLPLFIMLGNHLPTEWIPSHLQVLFAAGRWEKSNAVLPALARATLSHTTHLLPAWLRSKQDQGATGVCFRWACNTVTNDLAGCHNDHVSHLVDGTIIAAGPAAAVQRLFHAKLDRVQVTPAPVGLAWPGPAAAGPQFQAALTASTYCAAVQPRSS
jgi:hypothetical protein